MEQTISEETKKQRLDALDKITKKLNEIYMREKMEILDCLCLSSEDKWAADQLISSILSEMTKSTSITSYKASGLSIFIVGIILGQNGQAHVGTLDS